MFKFVARHNVLNFKVSFLCFGIPLGQNTNPQSEVTK